MKNKKLWISVLAGIMAAIMILTLVLQLIPVSAGAATSDEIREEIDQMEEEQKGLQDQLDELEAQRKENLTEIQDIVDQKNIVDEQVSLLHEQVDNINQQIAALAVMIANKQVELDEAQAQLEEMRKKHLERLRAMEEDGSLSYWEVLFQANSFIDLLDRLSMVQEIAAADKKRLEEMDAAAEVVKNAQISLQEEQARLRRTREDLAGKQAELDKKAAEAAELLTALISKGEEYEKWLMEKEKELEQLEEDILNMESEFDRVKYEEWLATSVTTKPTVPATTKPSGQSTQIYRAGVALTPNVGIDGNTWLTPCDYNRISSTFGMRFHPIYHYDKMHNGVDLAVGCTPIYATRGGVVTLAPASKDPSAGYWVIIDHGDGLRSVYMHMCKRPYVRVGDFVAAGQEIGCVGSTGASTGSHLHFGVSKFNPSLGKYEYVNPLDYIKS